jgi:4-coumarate--CoA ligase
LLVLKASTNAPTVPRDLPLWTWLFDSPYSPLKNNSPSQVAGYTNCATEERISYADVKQHTTHLSTALVRKHGLKQNETVALFSPNTIWYPVAMLATLRVGGVVSGASPAYNIEEMSYALQKANAKYLMTVPGSMEVAATAAKSVGIPLEHVFLLEGEMKGFTTVKELIAVGKSYGESGQVKPFVIPKGKTNGDICGFLSFSSGTTGLPKAVSPSMRSSLSHSLLIRGRL